MKRLAVIKWDLMIAVVLVAAVIVRVPTNEMRAGFEFTVRCGIVLLFSAYLFKINKWAGMFLLLALFSHTFPVFYITHFKILQTQGSHLALNSVLYGLVLYMIIVRKCSRHERILDAICVLSLANVLFLVVVKYGGDPYALIGLSSNIEDIHCGLMSNPNESSAFLALCLPAFFRKGWVYLIPLSIIGLILSGSFGGALGMGLAGIIFVSCHGFFWFIFLILGLVATYWLLVDEPGITARYSVLKKAFLICIENNPVLGCGLGNWKTFYPHLVHAGKIEPGFIRLHNSFVQAYVEMGVGFFLVLAGYLVNIWRKIGFGRAALSLSALGAIAGTMMSNSMFRMNALNGMIAVVWLAILEIQLRKA